MNTQLRLGFKANAHLPLVVKGTIIATVVEIDSHAQNCKSITASKGDTTVAQANTQIIPQNRTAVFSALAPSNAAPSLRVDGGLSSLLWRFSYSAHGVLDLADKEVQLKRGFGFDGLKIGHDDIGNRLAEVPHHP